MATKPLVMYGVGDVAPYWDDLATSFRHVAPMLRAGDLAFCQLESVLSEGEKLITEYRLSPDGREVLLV